VNRGDKPGQMGDALPAVDLGTGAKAVALRARGSQTCALLATGELKCWGANGSGQLGQGDTQVRGDKPGQMGDALLPIALGASVAHANSGGTPCAWLVDGRLKCWGANGQGQLGLGDKSNRGDAPGEMGAALPAVDLGSKGAVAQSASGSLHTCVRFADGTIACWGSNSRGQLGLGAVANVGDQPGQMGDALPHVDLGAGAKATQLSVGTIHDCVVLEGGKVKCWGYNFQGQLGLGDTDDRGDQAGEMGDALPFVDLGTNRKAVSLVSDNLSTCALLDDGHVKCWGSRLVSAGTTKVFGSTPGTMGDALPSIDLGASKVTALAPGPCALFEDGRVTCWGKNESGQLGLGDTLDRGDVEQKGAALPLVDLGSAL
ncbi:MAG: hypothetical protein EOO75_15490, partial [Myxococcales bacterium]